MRQFLLFILLAIFATPCFGQGFFVDDTASGTFTDTTSFDGILSAADTDLQKVCDTIDDSALTVSSGTTLFLELDGSNANSTIDIGSHGFVTSGGVTVGTIEISGEYTFPATDGSANQVIKTDGSGTLTWASDTSISTFLGLTDTPGSFTAGSVLFTSGSTVTEDNSNLYWDDTNDRLGLAQSTPTARAHVKGSTTDSSAYSIKVDDSSDTRLFYVRNDGRVEFKNFTFPTADGSADQVLTTNGSGTLTWASDTSISTFIGLTDTPSSFVGQGSKGLFVNSGETTVEFVDAATQAELDTHILNTSNPHSVTYAQVGAIQDAADSVNDTHIDFGSGANQVDLDDIPDGTTYVRISQSNHTDLTDAGESALHYHDSDRARANHTGTQTASTISDFDVEVSNNTDVSANTTHRSSDGSDHSFIDQDVTSGSSPTFDGTNFSGIPGTALNLVSGAIFVGDPSNYAVAVGVTGDVLLSTAGVTTIQADSVALTTDTTGNYVQSITNGTGISGADGGSEGAALTLSATLGDSISSGEISDGDHGDFTYSSGSASLDANVVADNEIDYVAVTLADFTDDVGYEEEIHVSEHENGGDDEISVSGLSGQLADAQTVGISKNSGAIVGTRPELNFVEGSGITLSISDDAVNDEVDITITSSAGGGNVTKVGTPVDDQVGVWTGDGTIEGTTGFTYDGSNLQLTGDIGSTGTRITKGWFTDLESTNDITVGGTALGSIYANQGANTDITSLQNTALYVGRDTDNRLNWSTDDQLDIVIGGVTTSVSSITTGTSDNDKLVTQGYVDDNSGGASTFLSLTDTPSSFVGQGSKGLFVNSGETTVEFVDAATQAELDAHANSDGSSHTFIDQSVVSGASPTFTGTNFTGIDISSGTNLTASSGVDLTGDNVSAVPSEIDHDSLQNFVANEHVDHTSVTLTAGEGLIGGGDISSNRSFAIDFTEFAADTSVGSTDILPIDDGLNKKITFQNFQTSVDHTVLQNVGSNTHAQIDTHISNTSNPHTVTATQVGKDTAQWNADEIQGVTVDDTDIADGKVLKYNSSSGNLEYEVDSGAGGGATTFLELTDTPGSFTAGSVLFTSGSTVTEDNSNLYWDDTNNRLGLGQSSPTARLHSKGTTTDSSAYGLKVDDSSNAKNLYVRNDGQVEFKNYTFPTADGGDDQVLTTNGSGAVAWSDQILGGLGATSNLKVKTNATNPNYQVDVDADGVVVRNSSDLLQLFDLNLTVDVTSSGANGLDTGSEASSTWYYVYVIYNPTTSTAAGLLSTSSTSPTMPSGYTYKYMVGAARNDGSSNFLAFSQINEEVWYDAKQETATNLTATSFTTVDVSSHVPSASGKIKNVLFGSRSDSAYYFQLSYDGTNSRTVMNCGSASDGVGERWENYDSRYGAPDYVPLNGNNIYYKASGSSSSTKIYTRAWRWSHL